MCLQLCVDCQLTWPLCVVAVVRGGLLVVEVLGAGVAVTVVAAGSAMEVTCGQHHAPDREGN